MRRRKHSEVGSSESPECALVHFREKRKHYVHSVEDKFLGGKKNLYKEAQVLFFIIYFNVH